MITSNLKNNENCMILMKNIQKHQRNQIQKLHNKMRPTLKFSCSG